MGKVLLDAVANVSYKESVIEVASRAPHFSEARRLFSSSGEASMAAASTLPSTKEFAFGDLERELKVTRKVLERLPEKDFGWKPHEKSMSLGRLAMHVATLPQWMLTTLTQDELDFANPPQIRTEPKDHADLLQEFDKHVAAVKAATAHIDDKALQKPWTLRQGEKVLHSSSKATIMRVWCLNHMIHHRAQLCLYLRLLNVPVPAVYFNSADEPQWMFE
jgi:uncharacterized damage-inducible protein DinB